MYRIRITKAPKAAMGLVTGDQSGSGLYIAAARGALPKAQDGAVVDHFKNEMLKRYGKYLITDKAANRMYYGYPGPDGKLVENNFEVLTGKTADTDYIAPYTLEEMEKRSPAFQDKVRITPVGRFPVSRNPDIYGNPGLNIENSGSLAVHTTYDPAVRNAYYNNNNPADNYASYGCINCHKPDVNAVLKGFGDKDFIQIVDSRKSVADNVQLGEDNAYLYKHPEAGRMLFENTGAKVVHRKWNQDKGVYEGQDSDFDPFAQAIIEKKELAPVTVVGRRKKARPQQAAEEPVLVAGQTEPAQPAVIAVAPQRTADSPGRPVTGDAVSPVRYASIVDYLNDRGVDSSKANRMRIAQDLGLADYNYRANDNIALMRLLQQREAENGNRENIMREGGNVSNHMFDPGSAQQYLKPVDRADANIEAERGETIVGDFDQDGANEHLAIGGKRHAEGGTPLQVPSGSFVFSDTKKMRISGPMLEQFGKSASSKQKFTPAQLSKQYQLNKYKAILQDPNADKLDRDTAQLMLENNQMKLAKLAFLQEGVKGFPNGIPSMAMPLVQQALSRQSAMMPQEEAPANAGQPMNEMQARYGGLIKAASGYSAPPVDPYGGDRNTPRKDQQQIKLARGFNKFSTPWLTDYGYENNTAGLDAALKAVGYTGDTTDNKAVQRFLIQENMNKGNYKLFNNLLTNYHMTNQGVREGLPSGADALPADLAAKKDDPQTKALLEKAFVDGLFGVRSGEMLQNLLPDPYAPDLKPSTYKVPLIKFDRGTIDAKVVPQTINIPPKTNITWKKPGQESMPWWTQDKINFAASIGDRYNLKKYMPTYVGTDAVLPNATFYDPTRQLAANQEAANAQNMMSAMYAGPQRFRAVGSNIQGQGATNAANILAQVQNQNVGVANQFEGMRSEILNNQALRNAVAKKTYLDELATVNQQYDNSKAAANQNVRNNLLSGMSNAQRTYWMNKFTSQQFNLNPTNGQITYGEGRKDLFRRSGAGVSGTGTGSAGTPMAMLGAYKQLYDEFMKTMGDSTKAHEFAQKMTFGNRTKFDAGSDGDMQVSTSGVGMDPATLAMFQQLAPQFGAR